MPAVVRNPEEEKDWNRAKEIVRKQYPGKEEEDKDNFYALVTTVYKSIRKGHGDERWEGKEGWEALIQESKKSQSLKEWLVPVKVLRHGDHVAILTVMGRTLAEGTIQMILSDGIQVQVQRGTQATNTVYEHQTSLYVLQARDEEEAQKIQMREDIDGEPDILVLPKPGEAPELELIRKILGWVEDNRQAAILWGDIRSRGFDAAMKLHQIAETEAQELKRAFEKGKYLEMP